MHRFMMAFARLLAVAGGIVLAILILITCVSILGRSFNTLLHADLVQAMMPGLANALLGWGVGPVEGDFEIVQAGIAFAIFAFLPWCEITGGHATVDIFASRFPRGLDRWLLALTEIAFAIVMVIIAMQLKEGMDSKIRSGQTTFILQFPVWWGYAASLVGAAAAAVVAVYMAAVRLFEAATGRRIVAEYLGEVVE